MAYQPHIFSKQILRLKVVLKNISFTRISIISMRPESFTQFMNLNSQLSLHGDSNCIFTTKFPMSTEISTLHFINKIHYLGIQVMNQSHGSPVIVATWEVESRRCLVKALPWLLNEWLRNLAQFCLSHKKCYLKRKSDSIPQWQNTVLKLLSSALSTK